MSFSARFCAYLQILRSLPHSTKNSAIAESQNPGGTVLIPDPETFQSVIQRK